MNRMIKIIMIVGVFICGIMAIAYYAFIQIDFFGQKDPKIIEENLNRWHNTLLSYGSYDTITTMTIKFNRIKR